MMPMAGQDAVLDAAAMEWETQMRAAIVEGEHTPVLVDEKNRAMAAAHNKPPLGFRLLAVDHMHNVWSRRVHGLIR
jgi:hypothetical protein